MSVQIVIKPIDELKPYKRNPRRNDQAVDAVAASIKEFGFKVPIVIDTDGEIKQIPYSELVKEEVLPNG